MGSLYSRKLKYIMAALMLVGVFVATCVCLPLAKGKNVESGMQTVSLQQESNLQTVFSQQESTLQSELDINLTDKKVAIDAGHGGFDPGKESDTGLLEKDINLSIAKKVECILTRAGISVVMTRTEDRGLYDDNDSNKKRTDMAERCAIIKKCAPDVVISIHQNSYSEASVKGAQMFYYEGSEDGKRLALVLQDAFREMVDSSNKRVAKADDSYYMLRKTVAPTVIAECGFLSNPAEAQLLSTEDYQQKIADAICCAIVKYMLT